MPYHSLLYHARRLLATLKCLIFSPPDRSIAAICAGDLKRSGNPAAADFFGNRQDPAGKKGFPPGNIFRTV